MKLRIRLQNKGVANHPFWWIVVAPHRKNINGRFIQHVGYWTPREGVNVDRQITLNIPRIKYWMGCGAVPTPKIQRFLSFWDIMPKPWYPQKTPEELQAARKPESEWTEHQKWKEQKKRRRRERQKLTYVNYLKPMAKYKSYQTQHFHRFTLKIREKINAAERQNQILREIMLHNEFSKINRINELTGKIVTSESEELLKLEGELRQAKAELALLDKNTKNFSPVQKTKIIRQINTLVDKIREAEKQRYPFRHRASANTQVSENISQYELDRKIQYELITKKLESVNKELADLEKLYETVSLQEFANYLMQVQKRIHDPQVALQKAQEIFIERGRAGLGPLTKFELYYSDQILNDPQQLIDGDEEGEPPADWGYRKRRVATEKSQKKAKTVQETTEEKPPQEAAQATNQEAAQQPAKVHRRKKQQKDPYEGFASIKEHKLDLKQAQADLKHVTERQLLKVLLVRPDVIVPTNRPVHPFPDLNTYIPEEYYEPISDLNLQMQTFESIEPNDILQKYHMNRDILRKPAPPPPAKKVARKPATDSHKVWVKYKKSKQSNKKGSSKQSGEVL